MTTTKAQNAGEWLCVQKRSEIEAALNYSLVRQGPIPMAFEPFASAVVADVLRDKAIGKGTLEKAIVASPETAFEALTRAAQFKLLPGSAYRKFFLIPRTRRGRLEVNGQIGYMGLCDVTTRHPRVHSVEAFLVYEGEEFDFNPGTGKLHHRWNPRVDRSDDAMIAGYAKVIITEPQGVTPVLDAPLYWPMTRDDILKRRDCSDAYRYAEKGAKDSPWHLWFAEMARKTVLIGGLNHGSVPMDMGVGGLITAEIEQDVIRPAAPQPKPSRGSEIREALGMEPSEPPFDLVEEAVAWIKSRTSIADLRSGVDRWQHFEGIDAETIANAYEDKEHEL